MNDNLIKFFQPTYYVGYKSPISSFYYPMSGVDLTVLDHFNNFIFCDANYNRFIDFIFFDNYLGLNGFEIEKIEFLSDENYKWFHNKYNEIDKLTIFQDYLNEIPNDFLIKKYYLINKNTTVKQTLIIIQAESFSIAKILQDLGLNLNLVIKTPGYDFNDEQGSNLFLNKYQEVINFKPSYVLGYDIGNLTNYQNHEINNSFSYFSINESLMKALLAQRRGEGIARRFGADI